LIPIDSDQMQMAPTRPQKPLRQRAPSASSAAKVKAGLLDAFALHQRGQLVEAEQLYRNILRAAPDHFDATHLLGVVLLQRGQFLDGGQLIARALEINPNDPSAHNNRGTALRGLERIEDALASFDQAIALKPDHAEAINNRAIALKDPMLPLLARSDVQFFSLQKDLRPGDAEILRNHPHVTLLGGDIETFSDTAAIMSAMDLVISSDTSVVHLAGALGRPVWILLQFVPDWRWLLAGDYSPWYPSARLFRQDETRSWDGVIARVQAALTTALEDHPDEKHFAAPFRRL
jgi:tetratricopeptide (TPR) repeat protein